MRRGHDRMRKKDVFSDYCEAAGEEDLDKDKQYSFFYSMQISFIWNGSLSNYLLYIVVSQKQTNNNIFAKIGLGH